MTRTINISNIQFRYQLVFFVHIYGYIWLVDGCLWHLLPRQNLLSASFAQAKHVLQYVLPGCMICLIQYIKVNFSIFHVLMDNSHPSIPPWGGKMSTWWMMAIDGICAFKIDSLCPVGNQDMTALILHAPQGVDRRGGGSSWYRNDTVKGLSQGIKCFCKGLWCDVKVCGKVLHK